MIPIATPVLVPTLIMESAKYLGPLAQTIPPVVEAGFYGTLRGVSSNTPKRVKGLCQFSLDNLKKIQTVFNYVGAGSILVGLGQLALSYEKIHPKELAAIIATLAVVNIGTFSLYQTLFPQKKAACIGLLNQFITNLALSYISPENRSWALTRAASNAYSLWKNFHVKWISFYQTTTPNLTPSITITHDLLAVPHSGEKCPVCYDDFNIKKLAVLSCAHPHYVCIDCTKETIEKKQFHLDATLGIGTQRSSRTMTYYVMNLKAANLGNCPVCRGIREQAVSAYIHNGVKPGRQKASVKFTDIPPSSQSQKQSVWDDPNFQEKIFTVYNLAQATLMTLLQYPQLAPTVYKVQRYLSLIEAVGICTLWFCFVASYIEKRFKTNQKTTTIMTSLTLLPPAIITYFLAQTPKLQPQPILDMNAVLSKASIAKNIEVNWENPESYSCMRWVYLVRMITNIAFACFSKKRIYSLVNALSQGYSLYQLSQLKWIRVDHTIKEGLSQLHWGLNRVKFSTNFMTYPSCMSNATHLQSTLKAIYDYHLQLLKNSSWTLWRGEKTVFTNYFYRAKFGHIPIPSCGCTLKPYPIETVISAWSRFYGSLTVKHWLQWI